jgi:hypothetical protein
LILSREAGNDFELCLAQVNDECVPYQLGSMHPMLKVAQDQSIDA